MEHRANLEVIAPSIDEAVQIGLGELGLSKDQVDVEVLDQGGGGLFGIGGRQARVRLTVKAETTVAAGRASRPTRSTRPPRPARIPAEPLSAADVDNLLSITKATVQELLTHLDIRAEVEVRMGEADDEESAPPVLVDVSGGDLSILIGRHAETLNAFQLITRLIVGKEVGQAAHIVIDIAGYRQRHEEGLRVLAARMAEQAVSTGRRQTLEPMNPAERRIIHIALRDSTQVTTESVGEDPSRKVIIIPRN
jgi:spoIIIJ-associated protein